MSALDVEQLELPRTQVEAIRSMAIKENKPVTTLVAELLAAHVAATLRHEAYDRLGETIRRIQQQSIANGTDQMTIEEIDEEINQSRRERALLARTA